MNGKPRKIVTFTKVRLPYGWLGNMSPYPVEHKGNLYRTTEAWFQALRFEGYPEVQQEIRSEKSPMSAKMVAKKYSQLLNRTGEWDEADDDIDRMRLCLKLKLEQHPELIQMLIDTSDAVIIEDCTRRPGGSGKFWGAVLEDGRWVGRNVLGNLWMELRDSLTVSGTTETKKTSACPKCSSIRIVPIIYGLPRPELIERAGRGEIVLGGCLVFESAPNRSCVSCHYQWLEDLNDY
jgi:ribA/ribD-fused uncharacterized protein